MRQEKCGVYLFFCWKKEICIDLFKGDTIQTLIGNENNKYEIYKTWYKGVYKYTRVN